MVRTDELKRPGACIRYWVQGVEDAPTVVFLHGATLDHHAWDPQVDVLRKQYRTVTVDLRGHGLSTMDSRFDFDSAVADVMALLHRLRARPVALVGLSLGGNIAQEIVYRAPELVDALVVADSTCNTAPRHPLEATWAIAGLASLGMTSRETFLQRAALATAQDEAVQRYVLEVNANRSTRDAIQIVTSLLASALHTDRTYRLPVPTLLMHGDGDGMGDIVAGTRAWAEREPLGRYVTIPNAGHASNQDNPVAFTAELAAFLDRELLPIGRPADGLVRGGGLS
ncbi:MAG: alpha/beta fold hydrolase [Pseudonocardiales bacterium]|nr:alpha/beta fold hydrolase [Pseudonocardiales bacterium]